MTRKDYEQIADILSSIAEHHKVSIKMNELMDYFGERLQQKNNNFNITKFFLYIEKRIQR